MALEYKEISSNYTRKKPRILTIEDVAARKAKRSHKKRHSVKGEIARFNARKKKDMKNYIARRDAIMEKFQKLVRAYWNNEIENHPGRPDLPSRPRYDLPTKTRTRYK